jgi:peptidoglycan/LPS O-acetylase OafA/YrhL
MNAPLASARYRPQLDGLRAFAVLSVLVAHFWQPGPFPWILRQVDPGFLGVRLFFVLSGFLITRILIECRDHAEAAAANRLLMVRQFYGRRVLRIFPLYYFIVLVGILADVRPARDMWPWLVTYTSNFYTALWQQNPAYFGHFWTLAVEEQFYLVWPWLVIFTPRRWLMVVVSVAVGVAPVFRDVTLGRDAWGTLPWASLDTLGLGAMLAILMHQTTRPDVTYRRLQRLVLPIGLAGYLALHALAERDGDRVLVAFHEIAYGGVCCWFVASVDQGLKGPAGRLLGWSPLVYLGKISYGIYAYHLFVPWLFASGFAPFPRQLPPHGGARFVIGTVATVGIASVSWHLFERPINRLKRYLPYGSPATSKAVTGGEAPATL